MVINWNDSEKLTELLRNQILYRLKANSESPFSISLKNHKRGNNLFHDYLGLDFDTKFLDKSGLHILEISVNYNKGTEKIEHFVNEFLVDDKIFSPGMLLSNVQELDHFKHFLRLIDHHRAGDDYALSYKARNLNENPTKFQELEFAFHPKPVLDAIHGYIIKPILMIPRVKE